MRSRLLKSDAQSVSGRDMHETNAKLGLNPNLMLLRGLSDYTVYTSHPKFMKAKMNSISSRVAW